MVGQYASAMMRVRKHTQRRCEAWLPRETFSIRDLNPTDEVHCVEQDKETPRELLSWRQRGLIFRPRSETLSATTPRTVDRGACIGMDTANETPSRMLWMRYLREMPFAQRKRMVFYCSLVIAILSLAPHSVIPESADLIPGQDKIVHFGMYATLAGLAFWSIRLARRTHIHTIPVFAGSLVYGILMELLQQHLPALQRSFSYGDIVANGAGAASCLAVMAWRARSMQAAIPLLLLFLHGSTR